MAATAVTFVIAITSFGISFTSACVTVECMPPTTKLAPWTFGGTYNITDISNSLFHFKLFK